MKEMLCKIKVTGLSEKVDGKICRARFYSNGNYRSCFYGWFIKNGDGTFHNAFFNKNCTVEKVSNGW